MKRSESRKRAAALRQHQIHSKAFVPEPDELRPRFIADVMLGRLAKWLRIAGFDVLYSNRFTDEELVALSRRERRILLSRDTRLLVRRAVDRFIFLENEKIHAQIRQVFDAARITSLPGILTRCLACNEVLQEAAREEVCDRVPPFVYETQTQFKMCPKCRKIYWAGTHRQSVLRTLEKLIHSEF